jgi:RNA polymerase sigma-70 factor, ECF subfamily
MRISDEELLELVARRDTTAFTEIFHRHRRMLYRLALGILRERAEAEEAVQEAFVQVWNHADRYDLARASVQGWLSTITRSRSLDRLRAQKNRRTDNDDHGVASLKAALPSVEDTLMSGEIAQRVRQGLVALPQAQQRVVQLLFYEGLTHAEVAARLGAPLGTIKTRLRLALEKLKKSVSESSPGSRAQPG